MKAVTIALAVALAILGGISIHVYRLLQAERGYTQTLAARIKLLESTRFQFADVQEPVPTSPRLAGESAPGNVEEGAAAGSNDPLDRARQQAQAEYANDPAVQKMMREGKQRPSWILYGDLVKQLELLPGEADQFIQFLTDQRTRESENAKLNGGNPLVFIAERAKIQAETDAALMSLLGTDRFDEFRRYQITAPERNEINVLNMAVSALQMPLTDDQRARMLAAMREEKTAIPPPHATGYTEPSLADLPTTREGIEWFDNYFKRVRERYTQILSPGQLNEYDKFQLMRSYGTKMNQTESRASGGP